MADPNQFTVEIRQAIGEAVELVEHNEAWASVAEAECRRLRSALRECIRDIRHIGSTAVPGLFSKPIVDLIAGFDSLDDAISQIPRLSALDYVYLAEQNDSLLHRRWLMRQFRGRRTTHLHLVQYGSQAWNDRVLFCELLKNSARLRRKYEALKFGLAASHASDRAAYGEAKSAFIAECLRNA